jgi:hypothetical protein
MAANPRPAYYANQSVDKHPAYFDADEAAVLDPAILDSDIMQSPPSAHFVRKDSFAASNGVLTPTESHGWDHHIHGLPLEHAPPGAPAYHDQNGAYVRPGPPHPHPAYGHPAPHPSWPLEHASGDCTPTTALEYMPSHVQFEAPQYVHPHAEGPRGSISHGPPPPMPGPLGPQPQHAEPVVMQAPQVQTPMSPHSHADWMLMAEQSRPKRRATSPGVTSMDYRHRGDGIRKKNGRIDIPAERNIHTIDDLIDKATDEETIKELKQQKRLLRNREAA